MTTATPTAQDSEQSFDVVVVGSGCSGLACAMVASKHGLRTIVLEKSSFIGGTTAYSGGGAWIPNNIHQKSLGIIDDYESANRYLRHVLGDLYHHDAIDTYLRRGPEMVEWMEQNSDVQFKPCLLPDYHPGKEGACTGRTLLTREFDGRQLGRQRLRSIRYTLQGYHAFGSLQADPAELAFLTKPFRSFLNLSKSVRKIIRYGIDILRYGKGSEMANGNALVGRLMKSCDAAGVIVRTSSAVVRLEKSSGNFVVKVKQSNGSEKRIIARKGVVLASGGFGRSNSARTHLPHDWSVQPKHNTGDGQNMAVQAGARASGHLTSNMPPPNPKNGIFAPISLLRTKSGQIRRFPHFSADRTKPGSVIVGQDGRRFANEAEPYQEFVNTMHQRGITKAFMIGDSRFLKAYGMGMALPWPMSPRALIRDGYLLRAESVEELSRKLQIPLKSLRETLDSCTKNAETGIDPDFGRGESPYDIFLGDSSAGFRNPSLGTCRNPPYYAVTLYPGNVSSTYGLQTNTAAQVIGTGGKSIAGLYAVGVDANSIMRGEYPGGGSSIGVGMTFGYLAALHIAGLKQE
ncbi:hypothetical protein JX265_011627 [Neoarthrinium moseri]|uniref:FAD-dependent oxidoreductase 2 FAD-binding domain-containing protein n=1 Tax=Neoarthrinium moseri TaxID=1658444 RepID=A0A9P9WC45_9PEZI|nr:hypothetical protein JX265_011627 [Neoarthrinium moseri]